jgi:DNA-binding NarL/FixJ family response regulator
MIWNWLRRHPYLADTVIVLGLGVGSYTIKPRLTEREHEILRLLAGELSNAELAEKLFLSEATMKTHVSAVLRKLGVRDRVQAVIAAYDAGLVRPGSAA